MKRSSEVVYLPNPFLPRENSTDGYEFRQESFDKGYDSIHRGNDASNNSDVFIDAVEELKAELSALMSSGSQGKSKTCDKRMEIVAELKEQAKKKLEDEEEESQRRNARFIAEMKNRYSMPNLLVYAESPRKMRKLEVSSFFDKLMSRTAKKGSRKLRKTCSQVSLSTKNFLRGFIKKDK